MVLASLNNLEVSEISKKEINDPNCAIKPCSNWVKSTPLKSFDSLEISQTNPDSYLLLDFQIEADEKEQYYNVIRHLSSSAAIQENSVVTLEFDPSYESIILHKLGVFRKNVYIDKIDTARMEFVQQEKNISNSIYEGIKSWMIFLEDVQPGDIIDYSFSRIGRIPILEKHLSTTFFLQREVHISRGFFRLVGHNTNRFQFRGHLTSLKPKQQDLNDGKKEWIWEISNVPAYQVTPFLPIWYTPTPFIQITGFDDWAQVAKWGNPLFQLPQCYSEELKELASSLKSENILPEEQILQAIRFVQDEIRYLGFELGDNAYKPYDPHIVLKRRSGDCKDKVLFLMALLDLMDVRSCPALVNTSLREHIIDWLPTPTIFNHAILQIQFKNERFWIDPTQTYAGGTLRSMVCEPFGKCLLLSQETNDLTEIPFNPNVSLRKEITKLILNESDDSKMISETLYTGFWADNFRRLYYRGNELKVLEKRFEDFFSRQYGALALSSPFDIKDDLERNEIVIKLSYDIKRPWRIDEINQTPLIDLYASEIGGMLWLSIDAMRKTPCELSYPGYATEEFFVEIPETWSSWDSTSYHFEIDNDELRFLTEWKLKNPHCLHCYYELMTKKDHIPAEKIEKWYRDSQQISSLISRAFLLPKGKQSLSYSKDLKIAKWHQDSKSITSLISRTFSHLKENQGISSQSEPDNSFTVIKILFMLFFITTLVKWIVRAFV